MNITHARAALTLLVFVTAAPASAENWKVFEGPNGSTQGVWTLTVDDGKISGQAQMATITGGHVGYRFTVDIDADAYNLARTFSSDNLRCHYSGKLSPSGDRISGAATCGDSTTPWVAVRSPAMPTPASSN